MKFETKEEVQDQMKRHLKAEKHQIGMMNFSSKIEQIKFSEDTLQVLWDNRVILKVATEHLNLIYQVRTSNNSNIKMNYDTNYIHYNVIILK